MFLSQSTVDSINTAKSDEERTKRIFIGALNSYLGEDNIYAGTDNQVGSPTGVYMIANPDGTASVLGQPVSNRQGGNASYNASAGITPGLALLLVVGFYFLLKQ